MKRIIALAAVIMLFFTACGKDEFDPETYISPGQLSRYGMMVDTNQMMYNDVFVLGHLDIDESAVFKKDGKTYAPVKSDIYKSYDILKGVLETVYTDECVKDILETYDFYKDIDGVLCYDMSDADNTRTGTKWVRNPDIEAEVEEKEDGRCVLEYRFDCGKKDEIDEFEFVNTDKGYRLTALQYVD